MKPAPVSHLSSAAPVAGASDDVGDGGQGPRAATAQVGAEHGVGGEAGEGRGDEDGGDLFDREKPGGRGLQAHRGGDRGRGGQLYRTVGGPQAGQEPGANCQLDERGHREQGGDSVGPSVARGFERPAAGGGPDQKAGQRDEWADDGQLVRAD